MCLAVVGREAGPWIDGKRERHFRHLAGLGQPHLVLAGQHALAHNGVAGKAGRRWHQRRLGAHRPDHAVEALALGCGQFLDQLAIGTDDFHLHAADNVAGLLVIGDHRAIGGIVPHEIGITFRPATIALDALFHRCRGHQRDVGGHHRGRQVAQWRHVVDHPDAAAMRGQHQIIALLGLHDVAHGDGREIAGAELFPVRTAIAADEHAELGAGIEDLRIDPVFLDDVGVAADAGRRRASDAGEALAAIPGNEDVRGHVAEHVPVNGHIGGGGIMLAGFHPAHPIVRTQLQRLGDIGPGAAAIGRHLNIAIIGANPDGAGGLGAFADRIDRRVHFRRRVVDRDAA